MKNHLLEMAILAAIMKDTATSLTPTAEKQASRGIQLSTKVYRHRQKRMRMQKQSRKINR